MSLTAIQHLTVDLPLIATQHLPIRVTSVATIVVSMARVLDAISAVYLVWIVMFLGVSLAAPSAFGRSVWLLFREGFVHWAEVFLHERGNPVGLTVRSPIKSSGFMRLAVFCGCFLPQIVFVTRSRVWFVSLLGTRVLLGRSHCKAVCCSWAVLVATLCLPMIRCGCLLLVRRGKYSLSGMQCRCVMQRDTMCAHLTSVMPCTAIDLLSASVNVTLFASVYVMLFASVNVMLCASAFNPLSASINDLLSTGIDNLLSSAVNGLLFSTLNG